MGLRIGTPASPPWCVLWHARDSAPSPSLCNALGRRGFQVVLCQSASLAVARVLSIARDIDPEHDPDAVVILLAVEPAKLDGVPETIGVLRRSAPICRYWQYLEHALTPLTELTSEEIEQLKTYYDLRDIEQPAPPPLKLVFGDAPLSDAPHDPPPVTDPQNPSRPPRRPDAALGMPQPGRPQPGRPFSGVSTSEHANGSAASGEREPTAAHEPPVPGARSRAGSRGITPPKNLNGFDKVLIARLSDDELSMLLDEDEVTEAIGRPGDSVQSSTIPQHDMPGAAPTADATEIEGVASGPVTQTEPSSDPTAAPYNDGHLASFNRPHASETDLGAQRGTSGRSSPEPAHSQHADPTHTPGRQS